MRIRGLQSKLRPYYDPLGGYMSLPFSALMAFIFVFLSPNLLAQGIEGSQKKQLEKLQQYEKQVELLYSSLSLKAERVLPPLRALNISAMSFDDLVEVQKILAQFYALDTKLSSIPTKLRRPLSQQNFKELEKEMKFLEGLIKQL